MSEPTSTNPFADNNTEQENVVNEDNSNSDVVDDSSSSDVSSDNDRPVDLGNHEADVPVRQTHVNEAGHLVDEDGNKVFTTTEEAIKDGSFVLDSKGRMPGVYLDDLEQEALERRSKQYEKAFEKSVQGTNSLVERQVNVVNSPIPPVTVTTAQEHPVTDNTVSNNEQVVDENDDENMLPRNLSGAPLGH